MQKIQALKKGDFFRMKETSPVYVYNGYCRINKKYEAHKFDDVNHFRYIKKDKLVYTDFEF